MTVWILILALCPEWYLCTTAVQSTLEGKPTVNGPQFRAHFTVCLNCIVYHGRCLLALQQLVLDIFGGWFLDISHGTSMLLKCVLICMRADQPGVPTYRGAEGTTPVTSACRENR